MVPHPCLGSPRPHLTDEIYLLRDCRPIIALLLYTRYLLIVRNVGGYDTVVGTSYQSTQPLIDATATRVQQLRLSALRKVVTCCAIRRHPAARVPGAPPPRLLLLQESHGLTPSQMLPFFRSTVLGNRVGSFLQ